MIDKVDTIEEFSDLLILNIEKQINKENIYINTIENWFEISKNILDDDEIKDLNSNKLFNAFKEKLLNIIEVKYKVNIKKYFDKIEETELSLKELSDAITEDNLEKLLIKEKYILKDENNINNNKDNLEKTLKHYSILNKNKEDYIFAKIIAKKVVKNQKNIKGFNISNKGAINVFINQKTKEVLPDYYTVNDINDSSWNKKEIFTVENLINDLDLDFEKYEVDKYLDESIGSLNFYNNTNNIKSMELNLEDMLINVPTNNILVFAMLDLIDNDMLFSITKYLEDTSKIDNFYINEIGDIKVIFNKKIMTKETPLKNIKQFLYLDNFYETNLMDSKDGVLYISCNSKNYNNLYEINELQDLNENKVSDSLIIIPKNKTNEKDIIRIRYILKNENDINYIKENFHILKKEKILLDKNLLSDFDDLESLNFKNLNNYYKEIINIIPEKILEKSEKLNEKIRKKIELRIENKIKNKKENNVQNNMVKSLY